MWEHCDGEALAAMIHGKRAIEVSVDIKAGASEAARVRAGLELEDPAIELDGVIILDRAWVLEAADALEVPPRGRRTPRWLGVRGGVGEARIVAREKAVEHALGRGEGARLGEAQLDHEAILEGAEEALNPTLALRRLGGDPADAEFPEGPADLGLARGAAELVLHGERESGIRAKDALAIGVDGAGEPIAAGEVAQEQEVALGLLFRTKHAAEYLSCRIVDRTVEDEAGTAVLEPGVLAAVHLDEEARLRHALPPTAVRGRPARARTGDTGVPQEALDGGPGELQVLTLAKELREVAIVAAPVGGPR